MQLSRRPRRSRSSGPRSPTGCRPSIPVTGSASTSSTAWARRAQFAEDLIADIHAAIAGQARRGRRSIAARSSSGRPAPARRRSRKAIAKDCGVKFIQASAAGWMAEGVSLGPHIQAIRQDVRARRATTRRRSCSSTRSTASATARQFAGDNNSIYQTEVVNAVLEQMQGLDPAAPVVRHRRHEQRARRGPGAAARRPAGPGHPDPAARTARRSTRSTGTTSARSGPGIAVDPELDTTALGGMSVGLTGADVERIVRGAARRARKAGRAVSQVDVIDEITNKPRGTEADAAPDAGRARAHGDPRGGPCPRALPERVEGLGHRLRHDRPARRRHARLRGAAARTSASTSTDATTRSSSTSSSPAARPKSCATARRASPAARAATSSRPRRSRPGWSRSSAWGRRADSSGRTRLVGGPSRSPNTALLDAYERVLRTLKKHRQAAGRVGEGAGRPPGAARRRGAEDPLYGALAGAEELGGWTKQPLRSSQLA